MFLYLSPDLGIGTLTMISNHREIENYNGTWGWGMGSGNSLTTSTTNLLDVINNRSENDVDSHEIRLSGDTDKLSWTIGAYTFEEDNYGIIDVPVLRGYTPPAPTAWPMYYLVIPRYHQIIHRPRSWCRRRISSKNRYINNSIIILFKSISTNGPT